MPAALVGPAILCPRCQQQLPAVDGLLPGIQQEAGGASGCGFLLVLAAFVCGGGWTLLVYLFEAITSPGRASHYGTAFAAVATACAGLAGILRCVVRPSVGGVVDS